jgi:hypothetical protein
VKSVSNARRIIELGEGEDHTVLEEHVSASGCVALEE